MCGVYYLLDGITVVYVGSSRNIGRRIAEHQSKRDIPFDLYSYDECEESNRFERESRAIEEFNPKFNKNSVLTP